MKIVVKSRIALILSGNLANPQKEQIELGLTLWEGIFEGKHYTWLRWCDRNGNPLMTGDERALAERQRAERLAELLRETDESEPLKCFSLLRQKNASP